LSLVLGGLDYQQGHSVFACVGRFRLPGFSIVVEGHASTVWFRLVTWQICMWFRVEALVSEYEALVSEYDT
jgi:hypothetical protein